MVSQFARIFATTLGGLVIIWMIGEYFEISDDIYEVGASRHKILHGGLGRRLFTRVPARGPMRLERHR